MITRISDGTSEQELEGTIAEFCSDEYGSKFVQEAISKDSKLIGTVLEEIVQGDIVELSHDHHANFVGVPLLPKNH